MTHLVLLWLPPIALLACADIYVSIAMQMEDFQGITLEEGAELTYALMSYRWMFCQHNILSYFDLSDRLNKGNRIL